MKGPTTPKHAITTNATSSLQERGGTASMACQGRDKNLKTKHRVTRVNLNSNYSGEKLQVLKESTPISWAAKLKRAPGNT